MSRRPGFLVYGLLSAFVLGSAFPLYWSFVIGSVTKERAIQSPLPLYPGGHFLDILKNEWTREQEAKAAAPVASAQDEASRIEDGPASGGKEKKEKKPKVKMIRGGKR